MDEALKKITRSLVDNMGLRIREEWSISDRVE